MRLQEGAIGAISGAAVGDALGGATEGFSPEQIQLRYNGFVDGIVGPFNKDWKNARPVSPFHKGDGHITDDTLMTESLISIYEKVQSHLDAYLFAENIIPELIEKTRWIPELHQETLLVHRVFHAEKWLVLKLHHAHADPREGGVGNIVNCGATMYMAPVGIVNAGDPTAAYIEAIDITGAHQSSYGREAAGVFAACVAAAMAPQAKVPDVLDAALSHAHDGTKIALEAVLKEADSISDWRTSLARLRAAIAPHDSMADSYREPGPDARKPSRLKSIEEFPIALAILKITQGDFKEGILAAVNYGRDSDSIATMFGAISGAMFGRNTIPKEWIETVERESKRDFYANGMKMAEIAKSIYEKDQLRNQKTRSNQETLFSKPVLSRIK